MKKVVLDGFIDEHGGHVFELGADVERVAKSSWRHTQHTPAVSVEWRKSTELTVRLARFAGVEVVAGLQDARVVTGRRRLRSRRRLRVDEPLLSFRADVAVVILSLRRYSLKQ